MSTLREIETVKEAQLWLRLERQKLGWTAKDAASKIQEAATRAGESLKVSQQAISLFETGRTKSFPPWLRYFDVVLLAARVQEREDFFAAARDEEDLAEARRVDMTRLWGRLHPDDQETILRLMRSLTGEDAVVSGPREDMLLEHRAGGEFDEEDQ